MSSTPQSHRRLPYRPRAGQQDRCRGRGCQPPPRQSTHILDVAVTHHPDIQLTYSDVIVTLASHDVRGITGRDLDLARQISSHAAELGIDSDTSGLTQLELGLDTALGPQLAPF